MKRNTRVKTSSGLSESVIQQSLISACRLLESGFFVGLDPVTELDMIYSIPNEGVRSGYMAGVMSRMGLLKGIADLCLPVRSYDGLYGSLYLEMKTPSGVVRPEQRHVHGRLRDLGNKVVVCRSARHGLTEICEHLGRDDVIEYGIDLIINPGL